MPRPKPYHTLHKLSTTLYLLTLILSLIATSTSSIVRSS